MSESTKVLNAHQQVFALSLMANSVRCIKGTQAQLQSEVEKKLPVFLKELPGWQVVWGPVVWKNRPCDAETGPDHVFFVAKNPKFKLSNGEEKETYVLAIAGSATTYNWAENNARVNQVVDFHAWLKSGITTEPQPQVATSRENCYIAFGTALGVYRLTTVVPPSSAASPGVALPAYWASFPESPDTKNTRVILTGHSLGAALSSTLALGLLESRAFAKFSLSNILVYPTGGPTAGNNVFVKLFSDRFPKIPSTGLGYEAWNCNVVNHRDVVSHGWCTSELASPEQNMDKIPPIYGKPLWPIVLGVSLGKFWANLSGVIYFPIRAVRFWGAAPTHEPHTKDEFFKIAKVQHMHEFFVLFGIDIPKVQVLTGEEDGLQVMSSLEEARTEPVLCDIIARIEAEEKEKEGIPEDYESYRALSEDFTV